jgi:NAD-dependent dihydropyrimidine dehydrogenase PreA subunit
MILGGKDMKNDNDNLKEKEIKQKKAMNLNELENVSGGGRLFQGYYHVDESICEVDKCGENASCARDCKNVCTTGALRYKSSNGRFIMHICEDNCTKCGNCVEACPRRAIYWSLL